MHIEDNEFVLTRADARALLAFACPDDARVFIHGVWFDRARSRAFASDGHTAVVAQCSGDVVSHEPPRLVPYADFEAATKALSKRDLLRVATADPAGSGATLGTGGDTAILTIDGSDRRTPRPPYSLPLVRCPDEQPPPVDHVIPRLDSATRPMPGWTSFNAAYLARATLLAAAVDGEQNAVEFWPAEEQLMASVLVATGESVEWTAAIMPVRSARTARRCTADEAMAWACRVAAEETGRDKDALVQEVQGALRGTARLPAPEAEHQGEPPKKRKRRKKPTLRVVASK